MKLGDGYIGPHYTVFSSLVCVESLYNNKVKKFREAAASEKRELQLGGSYSNSGIHVSAPCANMWIKKGHSSSVESPLVDLKESRPL